MQVVKSFAVAVTSAAGYTHYNKPELADVAWLLVALCAFIFLLIWHKLPHKQASWQYAVWIHLQENIWRQCSIGGMLFVVIGLAIALTHYARAAVLWPLDAITILGLAMTATGIVMALLAMFFPALPPHIRHHS